MRCFNAKNPDRPAVAANAKRRRKEEAEARRRAKERARVAPPRYYGDAWADVAILLLVFVCVVSLLACFTFFTFAVFVPNGGD